MVSNHTNMYDKIHHIDEWNVFKLLKGALIHSVIFKLYFAIILALSSSVQIVQKMNWLRFSNFWTFAARVYFSEDNAILQRMSQRKCIAKYVEETVYFTKYVEETVHLHFLQFANEKPEIIASSNQGNIGAGFSEDNMIEWIYDSATWFLIL